MNTIYMMCGIPLSGKSNIAKELSIEKDAVIHSSDSLREELWGDESIQQDNKELFRELHTRIKSDLGTGQNVIYDATNINYKRRMAFLQDIKDIDCEKIAVLCMKPYEDCLKDNQERDRVVPEDVIKRMYKTFVIPQSFEGWDSVIVRSEGKQEMPVDCNQDNPHHTLSVLEHCQRTRDILTTMTDDQYILRAAELHDIGKPFTKTFSNMKGEPTEIAHYYDHHTVGAYMAFMMTRNFTIAKYIQWHMQPFFCETEKSINKWKKLLGEEFWNNLLLLHQADKLAH